jgi:hypothetical protein
MSNLSDKEIDRLSREAADSYEPDDSSLSWSRLEQKLVKEMPERPPDGFRFGRINPYAWAPAAVLIAGASFFFFKNTIYSKHSTQNSATVNKAAHSSSSHNQQTYEDAIRLDSISAGKPIIAIETKKPSLRKDAVAQSSAKVILISKKVYSFGKGGTQATDAGRIGSTRSSGITDSDSKITSDYSNTGSPYNRSGRKRHGSNATHPELFGDAESMTAENSNGSIYLPATGYNGAAPGNQGIPANHRDKNKIGLPFVVRDVNKPGMVSGNDSMLNQLAKSKTSLRQKSVHINRSLNFGLAFGPDYTDAGGITNNQIGNNIGLTVGYYLTNRLSVNTGIFYTNKFFWSKAHNYGFRPPANYPPTSYARTFAAPPPIDYINGASNIWELPFTLRYDFAQNEKTKFFASAGLSSYFMMKQTYIYFLHSGQNSLAFKKTDNSQVNYWFGEASISLGFETEVGKGVSFQAEPFLKIPMEKMGVENLKLNSYGFLLSFRYSPVLSRKKK